MHLQSKSSHQPPLRLEDEAFTWGVVGQTYAFIKNVYKCE